MAKTLYEFQKVGVDYIKNNKRCILGDDMGLGKTIQTVEALKGHESILISCPSGEIVKSWYRTILEQTGESVNVISGTGPSRARALYKNRKKWNIITHETLRVMSNEIGLINMTKPFNAFALDEAHRMRNHKSKLYHSAKAVVQSNPKIQTVMLTGTPLVKKAEELYSILSIMDPLNFNNRRAFIREFFRSEPIYGTDFVRYVPRKPELLKELMDDYMLRRLKTDEIDLPKKQIFDVDIALNPAQDYVYRKAEEDFYVALDSITDSYGNVINRELGIKNHLSMMLYLRQIAVSPDILDEMSEDLDGSKIDWLMDKLEEIWDTNENEKIVIFSQFNRCLDRLENIFKNKGIDCGKLHGKVPMDRRSMNVDRFNNTDDCKVFLTSQFAGGVGINLQSASIAIFLDLAWNPADNNQAIDRIYRIGQTKPVTIYRLLVKNSVESHVCKLLNQKEDLISSIISSEEIFAQLIKMRDYNNEELMDEIIAHSN